MFKPESKIEKKTINMLCEILSHFDAKDIKTYNIIAQCIVNQFYLKILNSKHKNYLKIFAKIKTNITKNKKTTNLHQQLLQRIAKRTLRKINPIDIQNCFFCHIEENQKWSKNKTIDFIHNDYIFFK